MWVWGFVTNSNFRIPISLQPAGVDVWYFKLSLFDLTEFIYSLKYQGSTTLGCKYIRSTTLGCKYLRNRKSKFVAKTQFIYKLQKSTNIWILLSAYTNVKLYSVLYNEINHNLSKFLIGFSVRTAQLNLKLTRLYKDDFLSQINRFLQ